MGTGLACSLAGPPLPFPLPLVPLTLDLWPGRCRAGGGWNSGLGAPRPKRLVAFHCRGCHSTPVNCYTDGEDSLWKRTVLRRGDKINEIMAGPRTQRTRLPSLRGPVIPFLQQEPQI